MIFKTYFSASSIGVHEKVTFPTGGISAPLAGVNRVTHLIGGSVGASVGSSVTTGSSVVRGSDTASSVTLSSVVNSTTSSACVDVVRVQEARRMLIKTNIANFAFIIFSHLIQKRANCNSLISFFDNTINCTKYIIFVDHNCKNGC